MSGHVRTEWRRGPEVPCPVRTIPVVLERMARNQLASRLWSIALFFHSALRLTRGREAVSISTQPRWTERIAPAKATTA